MRIVCDVDAGERKTPFIMVAFKKVVVAHRNVEQVTPCNARRIVVVILGSGRWYLQKRSTRMRCRAQIVGTYRSANGIRRARRCGMNPVAG